MPRYDVIIVGGGPVGLAMAVELGQRDVSVALIERHVTPQRIPKGQNLTNRTLEHFFFWNCVDELRAARVMPPGYPIGGVTAYGNLMGEYWYANGPQRNGGRGPGVAEYYYERNERLPQYCTEEVLRARLRDLPSVTTMFGWEASSVVHDDNGVRVTVAPVAEGAEAFFSWSADTEQQTNREATAPDSQVLESEYVVGCDGGRSLVRDTMGVDRTGKNFDQRMVLAVFRSKELHEGLKRFPEGTTYRVLKPELQGYWQFFGRIDVGEGFFFHAPVDRDTRPDNYDFLGLLHQAAGFTFDAEFDHVGFWDLRVSVGSEYRKGRAFIAGDAAHQHPPYGGQGLNNGLEDAANLGWKLAARVQGWGGEALLDSYKDERRTVFEQIGEQMIAGGIERDREWLNRYDPETDKPEFEAAWDKMANSGFGQENFDPNFAGSGVIMGPPDGKTGIFAPRTHAARAGFHLSPQPLSTGRNVYQELGPGLTLLALGASDADVVAIEQAAKANSIPLKVIRDNAEAERAKYEAPLILVRPDQYVVWVGNAAPDDAGAVVRKVAGL